MLTTQLVPNVDIFLTPEEITARATRLQADFPSLLKETGFTSHLLNAEAIANNGKIFEVKPGVFRVQSQSNPEGSYTVDTTKKTCTCPAHGKYPDTHCKHRIAVALYVGWFSQELPKPQRAPEPELVKGFFGSIQHFSLLASKYQWLVKIVGIDAPANLVTIQCENRDSTGQRFQIFKTPNGDPTSILTLDVPTLKDRFHFTPARDADADLYS